MTDNAAVDTSSVDDLLDSTLDDLEDLPTFSPFPAGAHRVAATASFKEINGKTCVDLSFKAMETLELANTSDTPVKAGDESSTLFMLDNEFGRGNMKKCLTPIGEALGTASIRETIEQCKDVECVILTSIRVDKNDKDKKYLNVKELQVA